MSTGLAGFAAAEGCVKRGRKWQALAQVKLLLQTRRSGAERRENGSDAATQKCKQAPVERRAQDCVRRDEQAKHATAKEGRCRRPLARRFGVCVAGPVQQWTAQLVSMASGDEEGVAGRRVQRKSGWPCASYVVRSRWITEEAPRQAVAEHGRMRSQHEQLGLKTQQKFTILLLNPPGCRRSYSRFPWPSTRTVMLAVARSAQSLFSQRQRQRPTARRTFAKANRCHDACEAPRVYADRRQPGASREPPRPARFL